ncbi:YwgA family protein [Caldalkalibacillus salinus]|uniref:YwgA family protein n=1 Tax=Caldalkalibacillus salinus TaxID=2803787 RepID=UPI0019212C88|nr:YwgA family protein [Caldalkalibacillus salinus]
MLKEHAKLLYLFQTAGQVTGRKKLQKIVYISKKFKYDFQERFNFHFYGPYSEELSLQIEELYNLGFIQEVKETKSGYTQYKYELSGKGKEYLEHYPTDMLAYESFVDTLNQESSRFLELVSTMLYFDKLQGDHLTEKVQRVKSKQNYSVEELEKANAFISHLKSLVPQN